MKRRARNCPICGTHSELGVEYLPENLDTSKLSSLSFASRKPPELLSNHMVICPTCDLAYADNPPEETELQRAYHDAGFDSKREALDAARAYIRAGSKAILQLQEKNSALEIGTGTGVFLEGLRDLGFTRVLGVEPSGEAIAAASDEIRPSIIHGMFEASDFESESFDLIACFMTLEHVYDPMVLVSQARDLLKPGGILITVTHNRNGLVNRILGRKSPIVDLEHMQLFSRGSLTQLFAKSGYTGFSQKSFINRYALGYWIRLAPLGERFRTTLVRLLQLLRIEQVRVPFNVGNTIAWGIKPLR